MGIERALVQIVDGEGCVVGWALRTTDSTPIGLPAPSAQPITTIIGTKNTTGDTAIVAAPGAGQRIVVRSVFVQNLSIVATTIQLKSGATLKRQALLQTQGASFQEFFPTFSEWRLGENEALNLNLSTANSHSYTVDYWLEDVV